MLKQLLPSCLALLFALTTHVKAQDPVPLVLEGDSVPGIGRVISVSDPFVSETGEWLVKALTDHPDSDADSVLLRNGVPALREGDPVLDPPGAVVDSIRDSMINRAGRLLTLLTLSGASSNFDQGIYLDGTLLIRTGDLVGSSEFSPGTTYSLFGTVRLDDADQIMVLCWVDDPAINGTLSSAILRVDTTGGTIQSTSVIVKEGDMIPGQSEPLESLGGPTLAAKWSLSGQTIYGAVLEGDSSLAPVVYRDSTLLAQQGSPSPVAGRNWFDLFSVLLEINSAGDYVFRGQLDGDNATNSLIVRNGTKFRQTGDSLPDIAPFAVTSFHHTPPIIDRNGQVLWYCEWSDPIVNRNTGLFLNDRLLVQKGVTVIAGKTIQSLPTVPGGYELSNNGRWAVFVATLAGSVWGAFLVDLSLGTTYCAAEWNSTGDPATIRATGSDLAGGNPLLLSAYQLPPNQFGYFLLSTTQDDIPFAGGSQGRLCLGGNIGRFTSQVGFSGPGGYLEQAVDTLSVPINPSGPILAGQTYNFQLWFRDENPGSTSNFSNATSIQFH